MVKVNISEISFNPFKKFINGGKLEEERIDKLVESIEHGTLQPNFVARKNSKGKWEISSGHHRLGAFKKKFGKDFKVEISEAKFSDEQMLVDMVRENLTQRGEGSFRDTEESIVLARDWVLSESQCSKRFGTLKKQLNTNKGKKGFQPVNGSARSIAEFLSKNGKAVSREMVRQYLNIHDNLDGNLKKKLENLEQKSDDDKEEKMGIRIATRLARIKDKSKQREAWQKVNECGLNTANAEKFITKFKEDNTITPEIITQQKYEEDYDERTGEINNSISLEKDFNNTSSDYHNTLFLLQKIKPEHFSKQEINAIIEQIEEIIQEENKTIKKLKGVKK